ncbi:MAG TPA: metallophosphoesterase [Clostridia bacterium]|nr:metallophosphoesterase [Clostridia bacterium]
MNKFFKVSFIVIIFTILLQSSVSYATVSSITNAKITSVKIAVFSDPHYFSPDLGVTGSKFDSYLSKTQKLIPQSEAILRKTVDSIKASDANIVLIPGDLVKDGEYIDHQVFAGFLQELRSSGKKVFVIAGNHDINNPAAYMYSGSKKTRIRNTSPADFKKIYNDFGYKEAIAADPNSLSYVVEPVKGLRIIAIDSCRYNNNLGQQTTSGEIQAKTLSWIEVQLKDAKSKGITVFGMMHHGLVQHFSFQSVLYSAFLVKNWQSMADKLADLGLKAVFTGHYHAQDISKYVSKKGNVIFDIETGSLVTYPNPYRMVEWSSDQKLNVTSHSIDSIDYDLGGKSFLDFSKASLVKSLYSDVPEMLTGLLSIFNTKDQALAKIKELGSTEFVPGKTFFDVIVETMLANHKGDEVMSPEVKTACEQLKASGSMEMKFAAQALLSIGIDPEPADNNVSLDLSKK